MDNESPNLGSADIRHDEDVSLLRTLIDAAKARVERSRALVADIERQQSMGRPAERRRP
jgi:hypothetical protein